MPRSHGQGVCRHCSLFAKVYDKGLCWTCVKDKGIRDGTASISKFGWRGRGVGGNGQVPPTSTTALPGTEEKIQVLSDRAAAGYALHHEDDPSERVRKRTRAGDTPVSLGE